MNQWTFTIKVSDILLHSWSSDVVVFTNIFSQKIPWLTSEWITGKVFFENLNKSEILITLDEIFVYINTLCDRCWKDFVEKRTLTNISIQAKILEQPLLTEDLLVIDPKDLTVDIEDFLRDQLLLHQELKTLCTNCEQMPVEDFNEDEDIVTWIIRH